MTAPPATKACWSTSRRLGAPAEQTSELLPALAVAPGKAPDGANAAASDEKARKRAEIAVARSILPCGGAIANR